MGNIKWVHMMYVSGGLLLAFLLVQTIDWVWGYFATPDELVTVAAGVVVAGAISVAAWRNENTFERSSEIVNELAKVTWPTRKETSAATVVVIITTIIASMLLGVFDLIWSWASGVIYS